MMKKLLSFFLILLLTTNLSTAQSSHLQWSANQISTNAQANEVIAFAVDALGNSFSINRTQDASSFYISDRLISYNTLGVKKWDIQTDSCFTNCNEKYNCILPIGNGDVIFIGYRETTANIWELIAKKYRSNGTLAWKKYNAITNGKPIKAVLDANNNILVALNVDGITTGNDFSVAKCSGTNGNLLWQSTIPDAGTNGDILFEILNDIVIDNNGNTYGIGLASNTFANIFRLMVSKWDSSGAIIYSNSIDNNLLLTSSINAKITTDNNGNLYAVHNLFNKIMLKKLTDSNAMATISKLIKKDSAFTQFADFKFANNKLYLLGNTNYRINDTSFQGFFETDKLYFVNKLDTNCNEIFLNTYLTTFNQSANDKGFGGAFQLEICNGQLLVSSMQKKNDIDQPYYIIHKIDTNGTSLWYDSSKADVGQHIKIGMDAQCNAYLNYDAFDGLPTLHSIIKKYTDALNFPMNISAIITKNTSVVYTASEVQITCTEATILSCKLIGMNGQEIKKYFPNQQQIRITKNELPSGIYIALLQTDKGAVGVKIQL
jgi:hypothetical protein